VEQDFEVVDLNEGKGENLGSHLLCVSVHSQYISRPYNKMGSSKNISDTEGARIEPHRGRRLLSIYRRVSPFLQANTGLLPETELIQSVIKQYSYFHCTRSNIELNSAR